MSDAVDICCLCDLPASDEDPITREHVPPKQFYPKSIRAGLNLWVVPTHKSCNQAHKADEEYFYHALYPLVANASPTTAAIIFDDLKRRAEKPQTPALMRGILKHARTTTNGGIVLPSGVVRIDVEIWRLQQVAIKIARCLFYREHACFMPYENCKDIRLCEREEEVPELYQLSWEMSKVSADELSMTDSGIILVTDANAGKPKSESELVFDYRSAYLKEQNLHLYSLRFWEAFIFCMAFDNPLTD